MHNTNISHVSYSANQFIYPSKQYKLVNKNMISELSSVKYMDFILISGYTIIKFEEYLYI
jgi:hypothetical protein